VADSGDVDFLVTSGMNDSFFAVNTALGNGGGLYIGNTDIVELNVNPPLMLHFNTNSASTDGGAVYLGEGGSLFVFGHVEFTSNSAGINGGAFFLDNGAALQLMEVSSSRPEVVVNNADTGGGVYAVGGSSIDCYGSVFGGSSNGNYAEFFDGGAIYLHNSTLNSYNCLYRNNQAPFHGGAIAAFNSSVTIDTDLGSCNPLAETCSSFHNNQADSDSDNTGKGGAIYNSEGEMSIDHTILFSNTAQSGGAIFQTGPADGEVNNSLFYRNSVVDAGSAIYVDDGDFDVSQTTLANNTGGDAFYSLSSGTINVFNSIAWGNTYGFFAMTWASTGCNIDQDGAVGIISNPLFVDPGIGDDYHLSPGSPAVNACPAGLPVDLDGLSRPVGTMYDMGAYEFIFYAFLPFISK
jgi:hypothetical protein